MLKYSDNVLIKSLSGDKLKVIQSRDGCDFITYLDGVNNSGDVETCLQSDRFITVEAEGLVGLRVEGPAVVLETKDGEYTLPVMRERGSLISDPPVSVPDLDPESTWDYDFSGKNLDTSFSNSITGIAAHLVIMGPNLVARNISNVLEMYGDSSTSKFCLSPKQFSLAQKLGKAKVRYWSSGEVVITGESGLEVAIKSAKKGLDLASLESRLKSGSSLFEADLSSLKVKTFGKFIVEKVILTFSEGKATFVTESARKTIECPGLTLTEPLSLEIMAKDLKHLVGKVSVSDMTVNNQTRYLIRTEDKNKVIYVMVGRSV